MSKLYSVFDHAKIFSILHKVATPCYLYDTELIGDTIKAALSYCKKYIKNPVQIHYAIKANNHPELLQVIKNSSLGADCVSGGEINQALRSGFEPQQIVFAGVGKFDWEIKLALEEGIYAFNVESMQEIEVINLIAGGCSKIANIFIRINPNIDAKTHKNISTGTSLNKFGVSFDDILLHFLPFIDKFRHIKFIGIHYHIGSQITNMQVYRDLCIQINENYQRLIQARINITDINVGGGLGVDYQLAERNPITNFNEYFKEFANNLSVPKSVMIHFELGRSIVAQSGILLSSIIYIKTTNNINFAIIDAGMNDLMRPALYGAKHSIKLLEKSDSNETYSYDIVGPICESTDIFASQVEMPILKRGYHLMIQTCGAYGRVLANTYNARNLVNEYLLN